jgi:LacI family transcriptional regulator
LLEILRGVDEELAAGKYDLMLYTSRQRASNESAFVSTLTQGLADGLLLLLPRGLEKYLQRLRQQHFPFVLIDHEGVEGGGPAVGATNYQGAYAATRYLLQLGHRRIGFITGNLDISPARVRPRPALAQPRAAADGDLRLQRRFGVRRHGGGARSRHAHSG